MWRASQVAILFVLLAAPAVYGVGEKYKVEKKKSTAAAAHASAASSPTEAAAELNRQALEHAYAGDVSELTEYMIFICVLSSTGCMEHEPLPGSTAPCNWRVNQAAVG
jgi:hypothetical protein